MLTGAGTQVGIRLDHHSTVYQPLAGSDLQTCRSDLTAGKALHDTRHSDACNHVQDVEYAVPPFLFVICVLLAMGRVWCEAATLSGQCVQAEELKHNCAIPHT